MAANVKWSFRYETAFNILQYNVSTKSLAAQGAEICRFFKRHLTWNTLYLEGEGIADHYCYAYLFKQFKNYFVSDERHISGCPGWSSSSVMGMAEVCPISYAVIIGRVNVTFKIRVDNVNNSVVSKRSNQFWRNIARKCGVCAPWMAWNLFSVWRYILILCFFEKHLGKDKVDEVNDASSWLMKWLHDDIITCDSFQLPLDLICWPTVRQTDGRKNHLIEMRGCI